MQNAHLKQYKEAIEDFSKAIELNPQDAEAYEYRGDAKDHLKQFTEPKKTTTKQLS